MVLLSTVAGLFVCFLYQAAAVVVGARVVVMVAYFAELGPCSCCHFTFPWPRKGPLTHVEGLGSSLCRLLVSMLLCSASEEDDRYIYIYIYVYMYIYIYYK